MGMQIIFVVETDKKCQSDWIYIKEAVYKFYEIDEARINLSKVFLGGKGRYKDNAKIKEVKSKIKQYSATSSNNISVVIYVFDTDNYDIDQEDKRFIEEAHSYCKSNGYELVWFCKDIEQVFLNKKVPNDKKRDEAAAFKRKSMIENINKNSLQSNKYRKNTSNLLNILDKYLKK